MIDLDKDDESDQSFGQPSWSVRDDDEPEVVEADAVPKIIDRPEVTVSELVRSDMPDEPVHSSAECVVPDDDVPDIGQPVVPDVTGPEVVGDQVPEMVDVLVVQASDVPEGELETDAIETSRAPPIAPPSLPSSIPAVNLLPATPNASQEEVPGPSTLLGIPATDTSQQVRTRSRSRSPVESSQIRRSQCLSPAPTTGTKRQASDPVEEPAAKKPKGK